MVITFSPSSNKYSLKLSKTCLTDTNLMRIAWWTITTNRVLRFLAMLAFLISLFLYYHAFCCAIDRMSDWEDNCILQVSSVLEAYSFTFTRITYPLVKHFVLLSFLFVMPRHKKWRGYYVIPYEICPSVRQRYHHSCPLHNSDTVQDIFTNINKCKTLWDDIPNTQIVTLVCLLFELLQSDLNLAIWMRVDPVLFHADREGCIMIEWVSRLIFLFAERICMKTPFRFTRLS